MSSIREALKRAERERLERGGVDARSGGNRTAEFAPFQPVAPSAPGVPNPQLSVIAQPPIPVLDVPVDIAQELAYFRQGVEAALPQANRSIVLASANEGEGVTTLANYLAASLALRDNRRTCLIDVNFDSPRTTSILGLLGKPGISDYCTGKADLADVLMRTESPQFYVIGLGTDNYNPSLVLSSDRARTLAKDLGQRFDYVLFDAGSVLGHAETSLLAGMVDGVVLIARANRTKREVLAKADKLIRFSGGRVLGTVLNRRTFPIPDSIYRRL